MNTRKNNSAPVSGSLLLMLAAALLFRVFLACTYRGFETDTACFYSWALQLWDKGLSNFYSPEYFCDYPPGYLYILYALGGLIRLLGICSLSGGCLLLLKIPAILCDLGAGALIYRFAGRYFTPKSALLLSACYLFHPAVWINSALWGQVDAIFTLLILAVCILLTNRQSIPAYFLYALSILVKPQALMFAPLIICAVLEYGFTHKSAKKLLTNLASGFCAILLLLLLSLPFGLENVFAQYTDTLSSYPYAAVNACNLWGLLGLNWVSQDTMLGIFTYAQLGTFAIVLMTLCAFLLFFRLRSKESRYYLTGAFLVVSMFLFSVRMHERYLFPAVLLLLFAFIHSRNKAYFYHYWLISAAHFGNVYYVLYHYDPYNYDRKAPAILLLSLLTLVSGCAFYLSLIRSARGKEQACESFALLETNESLRRTSKTLTGAGADAVRAPGSLPGKKFSPGNGTVSDDSVIRPTVASLKMKAADWIIMAGISLFYGFFAFWNLGILDTPVTECEFPYNTYLELETREDKTISNIYWYLLNEQDIICRLETRVSEDAEWIYVQDITLKSVFTWDGISLSEPVQAIRITNLTKDTNIGELVLTDAANKPVSILQDSIYFSLFDETDTFPETLNAQTGAYFDEIYYTRTAYEFMNGLQTYENTHPPMGKILIALGASIWGTSPFGFRFMGALLGVLMLPFMYLLGRNITKNRFLGSLCAFLFAFDFMHFAQTRLTTIDVFVTFFIILMYCFMEQYSRMNFYDTPLSKTFLPLGACGIAFGFGIASKWTGAYAGAGLAVIFFLQLYQRYREYRYALTDPKGTTKGIRHRHIIRYFRENTIKTLCFCIVFFVIIPFMIYLLSYIPFVDSSHSGLFQRMAENQVSMLNYHSSLTATHAYSSVWYEWPTMIRPIFYYSKVLSENLRLGISSFGNPLVWWAGIPALVGTLYLALFKKDSAARFLLIAYLAQLLPWTLVSRCTFIYHYFPCVPFAVCMLVYCFLQLKKHVTAKCFYTLMATYGIAAFVLFLLFYPVLAGTPVTTDYVSTWLRWLDSWVLVMG